MTEAELTAREQRLQTLMRAVYAFGFAVAANIDPALCLAPVLTEFRALVDAHDAALADGPALVAEVRRLRGDGHNAPCPRCGELLFCPHCGLGSGT